MQFGAVFPQTEIGADPADLRRYALAVEAMGYDYVVFYDHVLGANPEREGGWRGPYTHESTFHEPLTTFSWMSGFTERLEFVTSILVLPARQTALVAKQAAQLDLLSGGRLRLGVAVGWNAVEFEALGEDFSTRGTRIEEQITVLRALWQDPLVKFDGEYHTIDDAGLNPLPAQRPIPIWVGGMADVVLRRAAKLGDGWMPNPVPIETGREMVKRLHGYLREEGRSPDDFGLDVRCSLRFHDDEAGWARFIDAWRPLGATHVSFNTMNVGLPSLDDHLELLGRFMQTVRST